MADRIILLSIPQLRRRDVTPGCLASLDAMASRGAVAELVPPFPDLAASSFATLVTGTGPYAHGLIGNSYFDRETRKVVPGPLPDSAVEAPKIWERLRKGRPGAKTLLWFAPNTKGATAGVIAGIDAQSQVGTEPDGLAADLVSRFGPFPTLDRRSSPEPPRLEATAWILKTAAYAIETHAPDLAIVRVPYLGQVARRFGPDGREAGRAILALETVLAPFLKTMRPGHLILAATESVTTPVTTPIFPNRVLRGLGMLALKPLDEGGVDVDLDQSAAFALSDHQVAHLYLNDTSQAATIASAFAGPHNDGIAAIAPGSRRAELGMDHARSGDVILVSTPDRWFAPNWWANVGEEPKTMPPSGLVPSGTLARVAIDQVKGSLGAPPPGSTYLGVVAASDPTILRGAEQLAARQLADLMLAALGVSTP